MTHYKIIYLLLSLMLISCGTSPVKTEKELNQLPNIFPDYADVTIPINIAPLNFKLTDWEGDAQAHFASENISLYLDAKKGRFDIPLADWKKLLKDAAGKNIDVKLSAKIEGQWSAYKTFAIHVSKDSIDPYLAYRLIEPGYEAWNEMGIYQRNLEDFTQTAIIENKMLGNDCINCHSFRMQDPSSILFHIRGNYPATMLISDDKIEKLNTKTPETMSALVYPSWHPSGRYIAFSVNLTKQDFHSMDRKRVEVYDNASDVVVYDVEKHEIITAPQLYSDAQFESFPTFSPDGKTLYFGSSDSCAMPQDYKKVKYNLCSISFDPENRKFGNQVDTIFNAHTENKSASFPRISPDGKYLLYTMGDYGSFYIWHKEADLHMANLSTGKHYPLSKANSEYAESYHSWSSNSRWIVFSSRRIDGLYTRPFFAHIDPNGQASKAFVLPQKDSDFYHDLFKSYNVPEMIKGKVEMSSYAVAQKAKFDKGTNLKFQKQ